MIIARNILLLAAFLAGAMSAHAAEIQLRDVCHISGNVVRISDIADVYDTDRAVAERLANTRLFPAPVRGARRTLTPRQIRDHLARAGWNLLEHRISGASEVVIHRDENIRLATAVLSGGRPISSTAAQNAHQRIELLLHDALRRNDKSGEGSVKRKVEFTLTPTQAKLVAESRQPLRVTKPIPAGSGNRRVELATAATANDSAATSRITLAVRVEEPHAVVVARRSLPKGKLIDHDDVELKYADGDRARRNSALRIEDVVGKETATQLSAGQTIEPRKVRQRILIRNGSVVTVYARNAGIKIRTTAKARESGARDDVIWVESTKTRKKYSARVIDVDTVEVLAQGVTVNRNR